MLNGKELKQQAACIMAESRFGSPPNPYSYVSTAMYNPVSTYRIQFHKGFTFSDFESIIPYLHQLVFHLIITSIFTTLVV